MAPRTEIYPYQPQFNAPTMMSGEKSAQHVAFNVGDKNDFQMNSGRRGQLFREWCEYVDENRSAEYETRDDYSHFQAMEGHDQGGDEPGAPALPAVWALLAQELH